MSVSVCLFVCLSVLMSQKPQSKLDEIFYMCYQGRSSVLLTTVEYVMYFRFCG